jgi:excisionase family DNA binding protein
MTEYLSAQQLAPRYGVTASTIKRWAREGRIPCVRPTARVIRFNVAAVDAAIGRDARRPGLLSLLQRSAL